MSASTARYLDHFDLDVTLRDAAIDEQNRPTRRMIANAAIGMHIEDAFYSVRELREAVSWIHEGEPGGKRKLASILSNPVGDDFQRCIYYCLAGRGVVEMIDDLMWLEELLEARGRIAGDIHRRRIKARPLVSPYVADEPDGPMVSAADDFRQGRSWWADPELGV
ncbi:MULTISPECIES: hypothetical protein [Sphingomonadaceae]|uniref:Uncharacterized protein n=4 Tax=root TaxID=1 RepID=A0A249N089_SPHXE|nr:MULTISPECIES: hypothetical protein [Sphingomonadaceae]MBJ7439470.1 hypothetical protein [Sphingopyxis sp.]TNE45004.1 MAG: hypothetical protein EP345_02135 [Sphingomonadales bacterium]HWH18444.1 hypothetical protein [Allosphingosinicella sp.]ASY46834.1 hypothetical protein CJD35_20325 [Sphingobium xenophagum]QGP81576.1 hypothetical protein GL174_20970 [Sphingobium sp. CAP-1]